MHVQLRLSEGEHPDYEAQKRAAHALRRLGFAQQLNSVQPQLNSRRDRGPTDIPSATGSNKTKERKKKMK